MKLEPGMAYNTKTLNKIFAFLSILLFLSTVWMLMEDFIRPWKFFQLQGMKIRREQLAGQIEEEGKKQDPKKLAQLQALLQSANREVETRNNEISALEKELIDVKGKLYSVNLLKGKGNSSLSETVYNYEIAALHHSPKEPDLKNKLEKDQKNYMTAAEDFKALEEKKKKIIAQLGILTEKQTKSQDEIKNLTGKLERLEKAKEMVTPNPVMALRNLPFIDFLDPTLKIEQVFTNYVTEDRYFQQVMRVDRCTTCHMNIDKSGFEEQKNPYKTHPNLDLMVGSNSPHPLVQYGCSSCHGGDNQRVRDFSAPAHTPVDEDQAHHWKTAYDWHPPHKILQPMYKLPHTEASCIKCHQGVSRVPKADKLNKGIELMEVSGCYGCHTIQNWEHLRKPAPSLVKVGSKLDKNFIKNWVWNPKQFNPKTKMPHFFMQSNNSREDHMAKNKVEVNAIGEYLVAISESFTPEKTVVTTAVDLERGKQLVSEKGCLGCHQVDNLDDKYKQSKAKRGPYLVNLGSKLSKDWLVSWLLKPSHYDPETIMPSFRLSVEEANDMADFLLASKNSAFEKLQFDPLDKNIRDELLIEYFNAFSSLDESKRKLSVMSDVDRTHELAKRSIGKYGCAGCHTIKGFEKAAKIGPELSFIGSKPITQFGFGHQKIPEQRDAWIKAHLENPRRWDIGVEKKFKDLQRMPNYYMSQEDINSILIVLLGYVNDYVPLKGVKRLSAQEQIVENGMKVVRDKNCMGCHRIDDKGGEILKNFQDDLSEAPPYLMSQGHRVKTAWFHEFLGNVQPIRPWIKIRMPSFELNNAEKNAIVAMFQQKADQPIFEEQLNHAKISWDANEREGAIALFKQLDCMQCHTQGLKDEAPLAPDLFKAHERLRGSWMEKWLSNPSAILEYTTMPNFWADNESQAPEILNGDVQAQIKALRKYIQEMHGRNPNDVKAELGI